MKKFHRWLIGISLCGIFISGIASANFRGTGGDSAGGGGLTLAQIITGITGIFAKLDLTNTFVKDQKINDADVLAGGTYSGMRLQTTERASYCLGPSDGQVKEFCFSGGNLLQIHGSNGSIYDGIVTGNQVLASDPGLNRHWWAPTGNTVMVGGTGTPETSFMVGSHQRTASTFLVDTTNDWTKHLPISAPAAGECDDAAEKGRMYYDSTSDEFKYCNGTAWEAFADGNTTAFTGLTDTPANYTGAAGKALRVNAAANAVEFIDVGTATVKEYFYEFPENASIGIYSDSQITLKYHLSGDFDVNVATLPSGPGLGGNFWSHSCRSYNSQDEDSENTTGLKEIWGAMASGVHIDCVISANTDTSWPTYYLTAYNTGTGDNITANLRVVSN